MDRNSAIATAANWLNLDPGDPGLNQLADSAVMVDKFGRLPNHPDWVATFCPYWLAADRAEIMAATSTAGEQVTKITADGASFETRPADWTTTAARFRGLSPISRYTAPAKFGTITLTAPTVGYIPTSAKGGRA